jgi:probable rRNA maturation factor
MLSMDIQRESEDPAPGDAALHAAVRAAIEIAGGEIADVNAEIPLELSLRIVDAPEIRALNKRYRGRDAATNVLSFPAELPPGLPFRHLGDVVVCAAIVRDEAVAQHKRSEAHWAHMLVHGTLHLLGYDHENDEEAEIMEALEAQALARLGWPCPYGSALSAPATQSMEALQ